MADKESYRVAIDILCCHLGMTFDEACEQLGLIDEDSQTNDNTSSTEQALVELLPTDSNK